MILVATHTHLYPGHRGTVSGLQSLAQLQPGRECLVEFSDGVATNGRISGKPEGWRLHTSAYRTHAGTDIADKAWPVEFSEDAEVIAFRILARAR